MKKFISMVAVVGLMAVAGCGGSSSSTKDLSQIPSPSESPSSFEGTYKLKSEDCANIIFSPTVQLIRANQQVNGYTVFIVNAEQGYNDVLAGIDEQGGAITCLADNAFTPNCDLACVGTADGDVVTGVCDDGVGNGVCNIRYEK